MRCPYCGHLEDRVVDSRETAGRAGHAPAPGLPLLRAPLHHLRADRGGAAAGGEEGRAPRGVRPEKIVEGVAIACQKRPVSAEEVEALVAAVERQLQELGEREIRTTVIGEAVMTRLRTLDEVAYVRFASVYRAFRDVGEFMTELEELARKGRGEQG